MHVNLLASFVPVFFLVPRVFFSRKILRVMILFLVKLTTTLARNNGCYVNLDKASSQPTGVGKKRASAPMLISEAQHRASA